MYRALLRDILQFQLGFKFVPRAEAASTSGRAPAAEGRNWIVDALRRNVETHPHWPVYRYLDAQGNVADMITCYGAYHTAQSVAAYLLGPCGLRPGDRVVLVYPPGVCLSDICTLCSIEASELVNLCTRTQHNTRRGKIAQIAQYTHVPPPYSHCCPCEGAADPVMNMYDYRPISGLLNFGEARECSL